MKDITGLCAAMGLKNTTSLNHASCTYIAVKISQCVWIVMGTGLVFIRPIKCSVWPFIIYCILNASGVTAHLQGEELENGQLMKWEELAAKAV